MFADTITLDFKGTDDLVLSKRKEEGYSSEYFGSVDVYDIVMTVKHTFPASRVSGQTSHLIRMDVTEYDSEGAIYRTFSTWRVFSTFKGRQDSTTITDLDSSMSEFLATGSNLADLIQGVS